MILRPNQNGFRNKRSTVGQILTVRCFVVDTEPWNNKDWKTQKNLCKTAM